MQSADAQFQCPVPGSTNMIPLFASLLWTYMFVHMREITGGMCSLPSSRLRGTEKKIIIMSCIPMALPKTKESPQILVNTGVSSGLDPPHLV